MMKIWTLGCCEPPRMQWYCGIFRLVLIVVLFCPPALADSDEAPDKGESAEASGSAGSGSPASAASAKPAKILDFCKLKPKHDAKRFTRQRVLMLGLSDDSVATAKEEEVNDAGDVVKEHEILKEVQTELQAEEVLLTAFPMRRFYNVVTHKELPSALFGKPTIDTAAVSKSLKDDEFARYSLGCTDWVVTTRFVTREGEWHKKDKQKTVNGKTVKYKAWVLDLTWTLELAIYRVKGDKLKLQGVVTGSNGGLFGFALGLAAGALQDDDSESAQPDHISGVPDSSCDLPTGKGGAGGAAISLAACAGFTLDFGIPGASAPGMGQAKSVYCKDVDDDASHGEESMKSVAICEVRKSIEHTTLALLKEVKRVDGWKLFAPLQAAAKHGDGAFGISLGEEEGVKRGDVYIAQKRLPDGSYESAGFGRLVSVGPGGEKGIEEPSRFKFRSGEAAMDTRMEEHSQVGIVLGLQPGLLLLTSSGDLESKTALGGNLMGGYNATQFLDFADELWSRIYLAYFIGADGESFTSLDVLPEATFYGPNRINFVVGAGFGYTSVSRKVPDYEQLGLSEDDAKISGSSYGLAGLAGVEVIVTPDIHTRLVANYRQNFSEAELKDSDGKVYGSGGSLSGLRVVLSGAYTF